MEPSVPLYARGHYRVLARADDPERAAWLVTDTAGTPLREEPSFDAARAWVDARQPDAPQHGAPAFAAPGARARRR